MSHEITPDVIARIASRIYNEVPHGNGMPTQPTLPASGASVPEVPSQLPFATVAPALSVQPPGPGASTHLPVTMAQPTSLFAQARSFPGAPGGSSPYKTLPGFLAGNQLPHSVGQTPAPGSGAGNFASGLPHGSAGLPASVLGHARNVPFASGASSPEGSLGHRSYQTPSDSSGTSTSLPHQPLRGGATHLPTGSSSGTDSSLDGLRNFVRRVRDTHLGEDDQTRNSPGPTLHRPLRTSAIVPSHGARPFDIDAIRADFPILRQQVHGRPIAWLDNAATTQKPQCVIDALKNFYENDNSNIHRAAHTLAARATDAYEKAREKVRAFLNASSVKEIVFVRGTTEGINLIAKTFGDKFLQPGDEIVLSVLEHHAQIVPWQMIAKRTGAALRVIPVNDNGEIMLEEYQRLLGPRTKVVALAHANNSLGTILPVAEMTHAAKRYGARVVIDGAQSVAHLPVDLQQLGADFYVFSGHKIFGPTGIGAVYVKEELHDFLPPWQGGGNMIRNVTFEETTYSEAPAKFEAGTPNIADAVGLGAALDYVNQLGLPNIAAYEHGLLHYATEHLSRINGLRLVGNAREKVGVLSFVLPNKRTEEIGRLLDQEGIAVRSGHHCAQPSLRRFGLETTVRPSLSIYNTCAEIDRLVDAVKRIQRMP